MEMIRTSADLNAATRVAIAASAVVVARSHIHGTDGGMLRDAFTGRRIMRVIRGSREPIGGRYRRRCAGKDDYQQE